MSVLASLNQISIKKNVETNKNNNPAVKKKNEWKIN